MKILYLVSEDYYFLRHRSLLARGVRDAGAEVFVMAHSNGMESQFRDAGFHYIPWQFSRGSVNPFREFRAIIQVLATYTRVRPDIVHHVALKPVLYGGLVARLLGVASVNAISGLGLAFTAESIKYRAMRAIWLRLMKSAMANPRAIAVFQNPENRDLLVNSGVVQAAQSVMIRGSGVDLRKFSPAPEPPGVPVVFLATRLLWTKGIQEFIDAARLLKERGVHAQFRLAGTGDPENPASASVETIARWKKEGIVDICGWVPDEEMPSALSNATLIAYPSYSEGLPRALLEAAACGRAIVATDVPGCREIVRDGHNGLLVPPRNAAALADAIELLLRSHDQRRTMGMRGRALVEHDFSDECVLEQSLAVYQSLFGERRLEAECTEI